MAWFKKHPLSAAEFPKGIYFHATLFEGPCRLKIGLEAYFSIRKEPGESSNIAAPYDFNWKATEGSR